MGHSKGDRLRYRRMLQEHCVDFPGGNFFSPTIDDLCKATCHEYIAIGIYKPLVAHPEPAMCEGTTVGGWIVVIALHDIRATDDKFTNFSGSQ
jgi:hypothetical protein